MTLLKIALTVLGTAGLTAGTVLAVAEPSPSQLPACAAQAGSCSACPKAGCGTAKCSTASACPIKAAAAAAKACTAGSGECIEKAAHFEFVGTTAANACAAAGTCSGESCDRNSKTPAATGVGGKSEAECAGGACAESQVTICGSEASGHGKCAGTVAESACGKSACGSGSCGKLSVGAAVNSAPGVVGRVVASESGCDSAGTACEGGHFSGSGFVGIGSALSACCDAAAECCTAGSCVADGTCSEEACGQEKRCLTLRFGITSDGPTIQLTSGANPSACTGGACPSACPASACGHDAGAKADCDASCQEAHQVSATACEAKPACVAAACPVSACEGPACAEEKCAASKCASCPSKCPAAGEVFVDVVEPKPSACSVAACDCADCCCEACDCETDTTCPPGAICPVAARIRELHAAGGQWRLTGRGEVPSAVHASDAAVGTARDYVYSRSASHDPVIEAPGRVRLTHFPDLNYVPPVAEFWSQISPTPWAQPIMAAGGGFETVGAWPQILTASFAMPEPVVAPSPQRTPAERSIKGVWARTVGVSAVSFVIDGDRIRGMCDDSVVFSGTCSVSRDGQVIGVIDDVQYSDEPTAALLVTQAIVDQPFAFRFTLDGPELIVKDFRCGGLDATSVEVDGVKTTLAARVAAFVCGRYERGE